MAQRQSKRTPEIEERIIDGLSNGVALRVLCREEDMPSWRTVYDWINADEDFATRVAHARDLGYEALAEDILGIADGTRAISEHVQVSKLRIDTRLKLLACWSPKRYGNKQTLDVGNKEGEALKIDANVDNVALTKKIGALIAQQPGADDPAS
jgi:hypothetical protein